MCGEILNISSDISWQIVWKIIVSKDSNSMHLEERQTIGEEKVEERSNIPVLETSFSSKLFLNNILPLPYHACTTPSFEIRFLRYPSRLHPRLFIFTLSQESMGTRFLMEDRFQQKNNNKPTVVEINRQQELRDNCNLLLMINDLDRVKLVVRGHRIYS